MTRKLTRNTDVLSGIAPSIAVLTVMIALAALAQTRGTGQPPGKSQAASETREASGPLLAQERPLLPGEGLTRRSLVARSGRRELGASAAELPFYLPVVTYFSGGGSAESVAVADVNGDGKPDLVVANLCLSRSNCMEGGVGVLLGNGDGTFQPAVEYDSGGYQALSIAVGDVNGDGKPDLVVSNQCASNCPGGIGVGSLGVLLGKGDGTFQSAVTYGSGGYFARSSAVGDVNGDGKPDLVVANECGPSSNCAHGSVGVLLGGGDGTFQAAMTIDLEYDALFLAVADVNSDNQPDLLVTNFFGVDVLLGNGNGTFKTAVRHGSGGSEPDSIAVGDVNGDGKPDLMTTSFLANNSCTDGSVGVALGNGDGTFQPTVSYCFSGEHAEFVGVEDVNGDGKVDLVVAKVCDSNECANGPDGLVGVLLGNGDGTFQQVADYDSGGINPVSVAISDLNGDGRPDLAVVGYGVGVLMNNSGTPPTTTTLVSSLNPAALKQVVTYTATVTNQSGGTVTGTVIFQDGGGTIAKVTLTGNQAAYSTSYTVPGVHSIIATYSGDLHNAGSTSAALTEYIKARSKTVVTTSGSPSFVGQSVTFTATVTSTYGAIPDGEPVTFHDGTIVIGSNLTKSGVTTFTTSSLKAKTHTIKAIYAGDATFMPSTGTVTQVVNKNPTTTTLTSSPNPSQFGQAVTFTAHVMSSGPIPTGKVVFLDGTLAIGSATLSGGVAKLTKSTLAVGTHSITAHYNGDAASSTSTSSVVNQVVQ